MNTTGLENATQGNGTVTNLEFNLDSLVTNTALFFLAVIPIYIGSFRSTKCKKSTDEEVDRSVFSIETKDFLGTGVAILIGIWYFVSGVFGTGVMVAVAKNLDAPIKVLFPRDFLMHGFYGKQLALLGLGDIVVPGIFIALLLRFDRKLGRENSCAYFYCGYIAYIVAIITTFVMMHVFKHAQEKNQTA
ncbi:unnamed protein product [Trichobilharzia regenti]|nr:unnamed protein product [Trichobilharzia regenti]